MTDLRIVREVSSVTRGTGDDSWAALRGTRDGAPFMASWVQGLCMEGRVFCANAGTVTTELTFGAGGIDTTEIDFGMTVPLGTTVIPLEIRCHMEAYGSTGVFEGMAAVGTGLVLGTDTDLVPGTNICNLRTDAPYVSNCSAGHSSSADATYFTKNSSEFWRVGQTKAVTATTADDDANVLTQPQTYVWSYRSGFFPVIRGMSTAGLAIYMSAQASKGFITVIFAEVPSNSIV